MLTPKGWIAIAVAAVLLAQTGGLMVQGRQLQRERQKVQALEHDFRAAKEGWSEALKSALRAETENATQAQEAAIVCQGEGAELFNRGRQVGIAIGRSQCTVR